MPSPAIHEVLFPVDLSRGMQGGPSWRTVVVGVAGGQEQRVQQWADPRGEWTISADQLDLTRYALVRSFWYARAGRANGFRVHDQSDYQATNEPLYPAGQNAANPVKGAATVQLVKSYGDAGATYIRNVYKPVASPAVTLRKNGSNLAFSSIDTTTGLVSLNAVSTQAITGISATNPAVISFSGTPVFAVNDIVMVTAVAGMTQINGTVATVTATGGSSITLGSVNALAYSAWTSGGTVTKYLATTDSLDWAGTFDVPARFDSDVSPVVNQDVGWKDFSSIRIVELKG